MSIGREHPIWPPLDPDEPRRKWQADAEARAVTRRAVASAWVVIVVVVGGAAATGFAGVDLLLHAQWRDAAMMLGISASSFAVLPFAWRSRRSHVDPLTGKDPAIETAESRAFLEAVERYDRQLEARGIVAKEADGDPDGQLRG